MDIKNFKKNQKGFTLIELAVVMAVFLFVVGAIITIFISIVRQQRRVLAEQEILSQISYAQEYMSKALRMAIRDDSGDCLGQDNEGYVYMLTRYDAVAGIFRGIKFINRSDSGSCQEFFFDYDNSLEHLVLKELKNSNDNLNAVPLTSSDLNITFAKFALNGSDGSVSVPDPSTWKSCVSSEKCGASDQDLVQPRVTILMGAKISNNDDQEDIIQTTVSERNLNK